MLQCSIQIVQHAAAARHVYAYTCTSSMVAGLPLVQEQRYYIGILQFAR
jgi:hypothetical protein